MVMRQRVLSFGIFLVLVAAAAAFVAANWGKVNDSPAGAALVAGRSAGSTTAAGAAGAAAKANSSGGTGQPAVPTVTGAAAAPAGADYFASAHLRQAQAESREINQLKALASDSGTSPTVRAEAQQQILQREQMQQEEASAELVLQAKGYPESLVMLRPGGATVVVQTSQFGPDDAARIAQAVAATAGLDPSQVQIVPRGVPTPSPATTQAKG